MNNAVLFNDFYVRSKDFRSKTHVCVVCLDLLSPPPIAFGELFRPAQTANTASLGDHSLESLFEADTLNEESSLQMDW